MDANTVGWFEIYVDDIARAKKFYEALLAKPLSEIAKPECPEGAPDFEMLAFEGGSKEAYGACGALVKMEGIKAGGNSTIIYFICEDCSVEESRVEKAGGKVVKSKFSIAPYGFIALATDSEGNMIGLHSMS